MQILQVFCYANLDIYMQIIRVIICYANAGKYMQMMQVLKSISFDVIISMSQLFDYYLYAVGDFQLFTLLSVIIVVKVIYLCIYLLISVFIYLLRNVSLAQSCGKSRRGPRFNSQHACRKRSGP